jgi:ribose 5-phosphate isomerase B
MKYYIGADHGGYELKCFIYELLKDKLDIEDLGCHNSDRVDYTDYANEVASKVSADLENTRGILICGTGMGMSIAANKHSGVRAALCSDAYVAKMSVIHNNTNILCMGNRVVGLGQAEDVVNAWLEAKFEGGRHVDRLAKML